MGNFRGRKLLGISWFWGYSRKFLRKIWGCGILWHTKASNPRKFSPSSFLLYGVLVLEPIIQLRQGPLYTATNEWGLYILLVTCCTLTRRQPWGTPWVGQSDQHKTAWTRERRRSLGFHVGAVPQWSSSPPLHRALLLSQDHDTNLGTHPEVVPLWMEHNQKHFYQLNAEFQ